MVNDVTFRKQKVVDLSSFIDVDFDESPCLRETQLSQFDAFVDENSPKLQIRFRNETDSSAQLQDVHN